MQKGRRQALFISLASCLYFLRIQQIVGICKIGVGRSCDDILRCNGLLHSCFGYTRILGNGNCFGHALGIHRAAVCEIGLAVAVAGISASAKIIRRSVNNCLSYTVLMSGICQSHCFCIIGNECTFDKH